MTDPNGAPMTDPDRLVNAQHWAATWRKSRALPEGVLAQLDWLVEQAELARELGDLLPRKQLTIERLRGLLARLEWAGTYWDGKRELAACPVCGVLADSEIVGQQPHEPDCWLAAELRTDRGLQKQKAAPPK